MKRRVLNRFLDYVACELPIVEGRWPSLEEVTEMIEDNPHYRALQDVGLPDGHDKRTGRQTLEHEVQFLALQTIKKIERRWIDDKVHDCLGLKELETIIAEEIGSLRPENSDALTFIQSYYHRLNESISNTLYYSKQVFSRQELEMMVPHVDSPFYKRHLIIEHYLEKMRRAKPEGHREAMEMLDGN